MHIGKRIQQRMKEKKITTQAMADACGVTAGAVSNWFSSGRIAKDNLAIVAKQLGTSINELITGEPDEAQPTPIPGASYEAQKLATWLDKIKDEQAHLVAYSAAMEQILRVVNGLPPLPTHTPAPHSLEEKPREQSRENEGFEQKPKKSRAGHNGR
jgi:transcriptional regulator with XRE-family HTH domain